MTATTLSPRASSLADYIRILADRMGMEDWHFQVREADLGSTLLSELVAVSVRARATPDELWVEVVPAPWLPGQSPEIQRLETVRLLVWFCDRDRRPKEVSYATAAAWAPSLPLPEVNES